MSKKLRKEWYAYIPVWPRKRLLVTADYKPHTLRFDWQMKHYKGKNNWHTTKEWAEMVGDV